MALSVEGVMPKSRSPRYPRYPLPAAVGYARKLYEGAHRSLVDTDTAFRVMGFAGKSGASSSALGAVRQYGLVDAPKGGVRISHLGLQVLEPSNSDEYAEALHVAANHPTVFAQLQLHFEGELPRSDEPIRAYLIRHLDFSRKGADECITSMRETFAFLETHAPPVAEQSVAVVETQSDDANGSNQDQTTTRKRGATAQIASEDTSDLVVVPLGRQCRVEMRFFGELSAGALNKLSRYVNLLQEDWAE